MTKRKAMTAADKARAYDELRLRAVEMGYACVGYALDNAERASK